MKPFLDLVRRMSRVGGVVNCVRVHPSRWGDPGIMRHARPESEDDVPLWTPDHDDSASWLAGGCSE